MLLRNWEVSLVIIPCQDTNLVVLSLDLVLVLSFIRFHVIFADLFKFCLRKLTKANLTFRDIEYFGSVLKILIQGQEGSQRITLSALISFQTSFVNLE